MALAVVYRERHRLTDMMAGPVSNVPVFPPKYDEMLAIQQEREQSQHITESHVSETDR